MGFKQKIQLRGYQNPSGTGNAWERRALDKKQGRPERAKIKWHYFQNECGNVRGDAFLIAPTGSGKTEVNSLWSHNNLKNHGFFTYSQQWLQQTRWETG